MKLPKHSYAFIDGSYNPKTKIYGCGGFLIDQRGRKHILQAVGDDPGLRKMRNVAGEILGSRLAIQKAVNLHMKKLTLFHDYEGIAKWPLGLWKCKKAATKEYSDFVRNVMNGSLKLYFQHVKGHSGIPGNDEADQLARLAVQLGGSK